MYCLCLQQQRCSLQAKRAIGPLENQGRDYPQRTLVFPKKNYFKWQWQIQPPLRITLNQTKSAPVF
jgi:hypothetical protein